MVNKPFIKPYSWEGGTLGDQSDHLVIGEGAKEAYNHVAGR